MDRRCVASRAPAILSVGLLSLAAMVASTSELPPSPCPLIFSYMTRAEGDPIGVVSLPLDVNKIPVTVKLHLIIRVALKTKYVGMLVLSENPTIVLGNLLSGKTKLVNYTVRFPLPHPVPVLKSLSVNNETLCTGKDVQVNNVFGGVITNIFLEHTFPAHPFYLRKTLHRILDEDEDPKKQNGEIRCGQPKMLLPNEKDGALYQKDWPWLVAIFLKDYGGDRFHCAGNLISKKHIVTAAHCLRNQINKNWNANDFIVYLGVKNFHLEQHQKSKAQVKRVIGIIIHPEYNEIDYKADIGILTIEETIFNEDVNPICIWNGGISLKPLIGHYGTVVGWGVDRSTMEMRSEPEVFHLPIVDQAECIRSRKEFLYITSERTLCAGLRNGTGPCNGDSGSGLLILSYNSKNSFAWHLRGLISLSLLDRKNETCDLNEYTVFTDIARFSSWMNHIIEHY